VKTLNKTTAWDIPCPRPLRFAERQADKDYPEEIGPNSLEENTVAQHIWYIYYLIGKRDKEFLREQVVDMSLRLETMEGTLGRLGFVGRIVDGVARFFRGTTPEAK
jgi:hypothetical protein